MVISSRNKSVMVNLSDESRTILEGVTGTSISLFKETVSVTMEKSAATIALGK